MTSAITAPPNQYGFGYGFNYAAWAEGTQVTLVNVPWNNDYRDIVKFADRAALNAYINSLEASGIVVNNVSYLKPNQPISLEIPFNAAYRYNYLRASNPLQPIPGDIQKDYYYFITDVQYVNPGNTRFTLQLDVWQTFGFDATFGNCYIERGHIGIANSNGFNNFGRDYLTVPEGLDTGGEYQVVTKKSRPIMAYDLTSDETIFHSNQLNVLVCSSVDLGAAPGTADDPILVSAKGGNFFNLPSGASYYLFESSNSFSNYLTTMQDFPWVTQGIMSVTAIPPVKRYLPSFAFAGDGVPTAAPQVALANIMYNMYTDWRNDVAVVNHIPTRYQYLKKLFTFPYMAIELTMFTGTPIILKPESWNDPDAKVLERFAPVPPNQRVVISPYKYNSTPGAPTDSLIPGSPTWIAGGDDYGDYVELATQMNNFPSFAVVNNGAISYLAANAHGIAFQNTSADWSQQRALRGNEMSYIQQTHGMELANSLTGIGVAANRAQTMLQNDLGTAKAIVGGIGSLGAGVASGSAAGIVGGAASAAAGGINTALDIGTRNASTAVQNNAANASNRAQVGNQGYLRDTNRGLADWSAKGDYENTIAGINSKVQDAKLIQPTTSGQVGGESLNLINNNSVVSMRIKMLDYANMTIVGEYWLRYGYAIHKFSTMPASLMVMTKFTYWKLTETYISSSMMPESFKQVIRGIFEKGVTVWANPADIGNIDISNNAPLGGITL